MIRLLGKKQDIYLNPEHIVGCVMDLDGGKQGIHATVYLSNGHSLEFRMEDAELIEQALKSVVTHEHQVRHNTVRR